MVACCVGLTGPKNVSAQGSTYVPIMDASYSYLDGLVAIGLVEVPSLIQRPYSRLTFSKFIKQARRNLDTLPQGPKQLGPRYSQKQAKNFQD